MKKGFLSVIIIFLSVQIQLKAQENIVVLHPLVGTTIDKMEMDRYALFSEHRNDSIAYFIVSTNKEKTYLFGVNGEKIIFNTEIESNYLSKQRENIVRLSSDETSFFETDSIPSTLYKNDFMNTETIKMNQINLTPEMRKSIQQSINQEQSQKRSKEYEENKKKGFNLKKLNREN